MQNHHAHLLGFQYLPDLVLAVCLALLSAGLSAETIDFTPIAGKLYMLSSNAGINVNSLLGANRFYAQGYRGSRAIQANIEAQHPWNSHETLSHLNTFVTGTGAVGSVGSHATAVAQAMGGRGSYAAWQQGIAPQATLWSGAIATSVSGSNFNISPQSTASVYSAILKTGVGGQTADVFNSSWGFSEPTGANLYTVGVDGLLYQTGKTGVVAAGNTGPGSNTVGGLAAGYNAITVAALGADTSSPSYNQASSFSSRSPNDYYNPLTGQVIAGVRARVDIAAPGQNLTLASTSGVASYSGNLAGTSFAAPIVAGAAALVVDAGKALYAGNANAIDGRVVKAVLLNGADKTAGWDNGQHTVNNIVTTSQSLDYATGAGRLNLDTTYAQYANKENGGDTGTSDVAGLGCQTPGLCDMGKVGRTGWDYGWANLGGASLYFIEPPLNAGMRFTATLDWYADINSGSDADFSGAAYRHLANLDLAIFEYDPLTQAILRTVAQSVSVYNTVEHLSLVLGGNGYYGLGVAYNGDLWNFNGALGEYFGLAWMAVAEPPALSLLVIGFWLLYWPSRAHKTR